MKMIETEAQMDLVRIIHSINKGPESWENWMCLHIARPKISADKPFRKEQLIHYIETCPNIH